MAEPPFDLPRAQRWFAVECNNRSWDLVEAAERTPPQVDEMLHAAHASCLHWLAAGEPVNHLRALVLLTTAYSRAGIAQAALRYADQAVGMVPQIAAATPFDRATAFGAAAGAYALAGNEQQARQWGEAAAHAAEAMENEDERQVFRALYGDGAQS